MVVFYTETSTGGFRYDFIQKLCDLICESDRAFWMIPLTVDDMWELED